MTEAVVWRACCVKLVLSLLTPLQGFNRALRGDMWRVRSQHYLYHDVNRIPLDFRLSLGNRYLADNGAFFRGEHNPYINLLFEYGDVFNDRENKPFDYFSADLTIGLSGNQPRVSRVHLLGRLWTAPVMTGKRVKTEWGVFQHFNFYDSAPVKDGTEITPYRISEAVGIGPGIVYRLENKGSLSVLEQHLYTSLILLGGSQSDYYSAIAPRDYNMGGGYSFKSRTTLVFPRLVRFVLQTNFYHLFTLKGYETRDLSGLNQLHFNVQGDRSRASLLVISPSFEFRLKGALAAILSGSYFHRSTHYRYHSNVSVGTFELKAGLSYRL